MVVLSAAICTRSGKAIISRQFIEMTRIRIEGLLAAFPKLLGTDGKQHTFVETDAVRYVYQPLENFFLLVITNRASNIIEDLETLRLLSKVVPDIAGSASNLSEEKLVEKSFDLIFAFDEVITTGGYREPVTIQQIRTNMEMESHEETLHKMIKLSKMETAKDKARDAARTIRERSASDVASKAMQGIGGGSSSSSMGGIGGGSKAPSSPSTQISMPDMSSYSSTQSSTSSKSKAAVKGMSLMSKGGKQKSLEDALVKEDKLAPVMSQSTSAAAAALEAVVPTQVQHPIMLSIVEKVSARLSRDGMIEMFDIKGSLSLTAADDEVSKCAVQLKPVNGGNFTFNTHPKVNKALYDSDSLLKLKDVSKGFPSARSVGILRWTYSGDADAVIPIKVNCWPEEESRGKMNVSIEYTLENDVELHDVRIRVPLGTDDSPEVLSVDGSTSYNSATNSIEWVINVMDKSNSAGSLEFNISQKMTDAFFPIDVSFTSPSLFCNVDVATINAAETDTPIMYGLTKIMTAEDYTIQ